MVQAKSLADVVKLADDPPEYHPQQNRDHSAETLVLYIARVPGSRDVFLTTLKPREKVVTAQDIQNALYYVHVDDVLGDQLRLSDELAVDGISREVFCEDSGDNSHLQGTFQFKRKVVPQNPQTTVGDKTGAQSSKRHPGFLKTAFEDDPGKLTARKPVGQSHPLSLRADASEPASSSEGLQGPRPMPSRSSASNRSSHIFPQRHGVDVRSRSKEPHSSISLPIDQSFDTRASNQADWEKRMVQKSGRFREFPFLSSDITPYNDQSQETKILLRSEDHKTNRRSLTLIRRYSGLQSNVGKIVMKDEQDDNGIDGIFIEISTYGYQKFIEKSRQSIVSESGTTSATAKDEDIADFLMPRDDVYQCHVMKSSGERRPTRGRNPGSTQSSFDLRSRDLESPSARRSGEGFGMFQRTNVNEDHVAGYARQPSKGFAFLSPWNGVCEFSTGFAARSIRCRHRCTPGEQALAVSELRFNLPSSTVFGSSTPKSPIAYPGASRRSRPSSFLSSLGHQRHFSESTVHDRGFWPKVELEDRLDLSLGQEHAGGGFGGKQAKLGKLIIECEGLEMLDLVVATNMGMYFKVYDGLAKSDAIPQ